MDLSVLLFFFFFFTSWSTTQLEANCDPFLFFSIFTAWSTTQLEAECAHFLFFLSLQYGSALDLVHFWIVQSELICLNKNICRVVWVTC